MKEFLSENKGKIVGSFSAAVAGAVLAGIVGTFAGEYVGYACLASYLYGLFGHRRVSALIEKRIKK